MRNIFLKPELQTEIDKEGYVIIPSYLNEEELNELRTFQGSRPLGEGEGFHMSNWSMELEARTEIYQKLVDVVGKRSNEFLDHYKPALACFAVKRSGDNTEMDLHQDWSLVDESKYSSVSIWVPLVDINRENGNIQVLKRSHKYVTAPRGQNIPVPFEELKETIKANHMMDISLKAGDAMIFEHKLVHGSPINKTEYPRVSAVLALIPKETHLVHYFIDPEGDPNKIEMLELEDDLYVQYDFFNYSQKPKHKKSIGQIDFEYRPITTADLI